MASFSYTAKDKSGVIHKGSLIATDRSAAAASLIERDFTPILIKAQGHKKDRGFSLSKISLGSKVKVTDKVVFSRQFATMINAGVPITQSLTILEAQASNPHLKKALADIAKRVEGGSTLSDALSQHADIFSEIYINMVRAGETGGMLDDVLDRLATQQEKDAELISRVRGAMIYPAVITSVTIGVFVFLMTVIVPSLANIFEGLGSELPWYTKLMLSISSALTNYGLYILAAGVAIVVFALRYFRTRRGKRILHRYLLKMPIFGQIIIKVNVARFARTFGSLMSSGISVLEALDSTAIALGNMTFKESLQSVAQQVKAGKPISEPLKQMSIFPPIVSQMVAVGEETGKMDEILLKLADFYEKEVDSIVAGITSIIEPLLIMVLGGMVGFIVISVFGPLSELSNAV